jgi:hypothetical protein
MVLKVDLPNEVPRWSGAHNDKMYQWMKDHWTKA